MPRLARRFQSLPPYPLTDVPAIKRELRERGVDVIDLGTGDADLAPPPAAVEALRGASQDPLNSRYSFQLGLVEFREEIARWMQSRFGVRVDAFKEVLPLIGSKEGIFHLPFAFVEEGDVTIIPDPGYQAYLGGTVLAGGEPYIVPLRPENDFLVPLDEIPADVVRRARILYLNYPNNPTAAAAPREYLEHAVEWCRRHDVILAYDNAYSEIAFDGYVPPSILEIPGASEVAIEFHSLSKTYNMTGWRTGWAVGNPELIGALTRVKTFADTGVPFTIQHAGVAALRSHADWVPGNVETFRRRRDAAVDALREAGFDVPRPQASMYLWVPLPEGVQSEPWARRLLLEQGVALLPGKSLGEGGEGFVRIALTCSEDRLRQAAARMAHMLETAPA
ncbi:aminotransferase class I/II-fold pyridoxal phosphate-dependent enzyme [Longimicrobium terrae]|uniref:LL-diaminopimelate aminotransferase n=1 Tax=Longimicrobium terrae TaxID=1639882 RepID=A0A841GWL9_9BACT|nr:aminotransferase class I/II-fold pyridoxal phosphate-dependent enzyme [Longimicrobium terrae]MBB4635201.1 LL-diaminopimelate aminotransferase [Longimicrobium terrae]MBB6069595.1 LL-diaminopimelate aminotransferase [Longimicrobium terrae]NNC31603.1 aminotransferase class I/II-fold pyridoxal phosphate-dependent enzyme [Longimicrobium terrae]